MFRLIALIFRRVVIQQRNQFLKVALLYAHDEEVANALYMAGQCLEQMGQTDGARERYREILDDHPETTFAGAARERLQAL